MNSEIIAKFHIVVGACPWPITFTDEELARRITSYLRRYPQCTVTELTLRLQLPVSRAISSRLIGQVLRRFRNTKYRADNRQPRRWRVIARLKRKRRSQGAK